VSLLSPSLFLFSDSSQNKKGKLTELVWMKPPTSRAASLVPAPFMPILFQAPTGALVAAQLLLPVPETKEVV